MRRLLSNPWVTAGLVVGALGIVGSNLYPLLIESNAGFTLFDDEQAAAALEPAAQTDGTLGLKPTEPADRETLAKAHAAGNPFVLPGLIQAPAPETEAEAEVESVETYPTLAAALISERGRFALLAERVVLEGETVAGWKVEKIESRSATLSRGTKWARVELADPAIPQEEPTGTHEDGAESVMAAHQ